MLNDRDLRAITWNNNQAKQLAFLALLRVFGSARVLVRSQADRVVLPAHVIAKHKPRIALDLGLNLARPTLVDVGSAGVDVRLSFGGVEHACYLPWDAIDVIQTRADAYREYVFAWSPDPSSGVSLTQEEPAGEVHGASGRRNGLRVIKGGRSD
jgi:hypothetical protein